MTDAPSAPGAQHEADGRAHMHLALASAWYLEHVRRGATGVGIASIGWGVLLAPAALVGVSGRWPIAGSLWVAGLALLAFVNAVINLKGAWRLTVRRVDAFDPAQHRADIGWRRAWPRLLSLAFFGVLCWLGMLTLMRLPDIRGHTTGLGLLLTSGPAWLRLAMLVLLAAQMLVCAAACDALLDRASAPRRTRLQRAVALVAVVCVVLAIVPRARAEALSLGGMCAAFAVALPFFRLALAASSIARRVR